MDSKEAENTLYEYEPSQSGMVPNVGIVQEGVPFTTHVKLEGSGFKLIGTHKAEAIEEEKESTDTKKETLRGTDKKGRLSENDK